MPSAVSDLCFEVERGPDWLLVGVANLDDDQYGSVALAEALEAMLERHSAHRLVLRLDNIGVLTSHLVGELVRLQDWVCRHGGLLRLAGLSPLNQRVLRECRLDERLHPYATWEEAVGGCSGPHHPR